MQDAARQRVPPFRLWDGTQRKRRRGTAVVGRGRRTAVVGRGRSAAVVGRGRGTVVVGRGRGTAVVGRGRGTAVVGRGRRLSLGRHGCMLPPPTIRNARGVRPGSTRTASHWASLCGSTSVAGCPRDLGSQVLAACRVLYRFNSGILQKKAGSLGEAQQSNIQERTSLICDSHMCGNFSALQFAQPGVGGCAPYPGSGSMRRERVVRTNENEAGFTLRIRCALRPCQFVGKMLNTNRKTDPSTVKATPQHSGQLAATCYSYFSILKFFAAVRTIEVAVLNRGHATFETKPNQTRGQRQNVTALFPQEVRRSRDLS